MNRTSVSLASLAIAFLPAVSFAQAASAPMSSVDKTFFMKAAQGGDTEVQASKLADAKAAKPEVKTFATQMVTDHTKAGDELKALASSKGVTLPSEPSSAQKSKIRALDAKTGADFDRLYAKDMVADHKETVALFKKTAASAKDPDVKAFAAKTLPTLEHHSMMAGELNKAVAMK